MSDTEDDAAEALARQFDQVADKMELTERMMRELARRLNLISERNPRSKMMYVCADQLAAGAKKADDWAAWVRSGKKLSEGQDE